MPTSLSYKEPTEKPPTDPDDPGPFQNEPVAEFRHAVVRERFAAAVARAQPFSAPVLIGGRAVDTADSIVSVDPSDPSRVVCRAGRARQQEADHAIELARAAQPSWAARC